MVRQYRVLSVVASADHTWLEQQLYYVLSGSRNPKSFLSMLKEKLKEIELQGNFYLASTPIQGEGFKIGSIAANAEEDLQNLDAASRERKMKN